MTTLDRPEHVHPLDVVERKRWQQMYESLAYQADRLAEAAYAQRDWDLADRLWTFGARLRSNAEILQEEM